MELLMDMEKVLSVAKVDLVLMRRTSVFSPLNLRKLSENHEVGIVLLCHLGNVLKPRSLIQTFVVQNAWFLIKKIQMFFNTYRISSPASVIALA